MAYYVHGFLDCKMIFRQQMPHLPRQGETVRLDGERYGTVIEAVWCLDEHSPLGQRINLRIETEKLPPEVAPTHTPRRRASGEYECSCGAVWDADEGSECPND